MKRQTLSAVACIFLAILQGISQPSHDFSVIAYYTGDDKKIDAYELDKLTHIIFSFGHLKEGRFHISNARDTTTIKHLVGLKQEYPQLKIMLSLGGWSGCEPCSDVFSTNEGRLLFAKSVKEVNDYFGTDGIDLDWEYPAIAGFPGHPYKPEDRENFTELVKSLRQVLGDKNELSFAAGGFQKFLDQSIEWNKVMPLVDRVNIMSYDLVHGYSTVTGHHTPIYSVRADEESANRAVAYLLNIGIPSSKLVIGAAFYTRVWKDVAPENNGRYQPGEHTNGYGFQQYETELTEQKGWKYYYDEAAEAPYWYHARDKRYATGDNLRSVAAKTHYALDKGLGGIMFWELTLDKEREGMVDAIDRVVHQ
ncbi:glycoside hydrolase family 18 protein [Parapedobacter koreensis]|uniref:chitinase n=1 Tax=Parapedobacter koreensis TaxID=332977 RepID=A0A1H7S8I7_9SPHI|nr:glycoside hydrolase family 18 protein [Parapedobacter koreensis]SEL67837.1 chitinase [Parapedobacter koreensis]